MHCCFGYHLWVGSLQGEEGGGVTVSSQLQLQPPSKVGLCRVVLEGIEAFPPAHCSLKAWGGIQQATCRLRGSTSSFSPLKCRNPAGFSLLSLYSTGTWQSLHSEQLSV